MHQNLEPIFLVDSVYPDDNYPKEIEIEFSLSVIPDDLNYFRELNFGSTSSSATVQASTIVTKEVVIKLVSTVAHTDLTFTANKAVVATDFPDSDPSGGAVEVTVVGKVVANATASLPALIAVLNNTNGVY